MRGLNTLRPTVSVALCDGESLDALGTTGLRIIQAARGFRHSMDAVLLAHFAAPRATDRVLDLGCGHGAVSLLLAGWHPDLRVVGLELQERLASRARRGVQLNGLQDRVQIVEGDLRHIETLLPPHDFDLVVCNPPYRQVGRGRLSADPEIRQAKHELSATLADVVRAIRYALAPEGRGCLIHHASRLADVTATLRAHRMEPRLLRSVHSYPGADAELILIEARRDGRQGLRVLPPLVLYQRPGGPIGPEMAAIVGHAEPPRTEQAPA
jgi:tRNA1(Val) A37 N6-methylase TrmN6